MNLRVRVKKLLEWIPFKKQFFQFLKHAPVPERVYKHLHFKGWFTVNVDSAHFVMYHYGFQLENEIFWRGFDGWERTSLRTWKILSRNARVIVDIGANTGLYALLSEAVNPHASIHAFEPVKRVFERLQRNVAANHFNIVPVAQAVSNFSGTGTIYDLPTEHIYSVTINKNYNPPDRPVIPTLVPVTTLDAYVQQFRLAGVDLIKIDVETHEAEVLEGALKTLRDFRPSILIEILNDDVAKRVMNLVEGLKYVYLLMDDDKGLLPMATIAVSRYTNYLLCSQALANDLLMNYDRPKNH